MRLPANQPATPLLRHHWSASVLSLVCLCFGDTLWAADAPLKDQLHLRRPIAAAWLDPGKLLAVANQRSGSISIVDIEKHKVLAEVAVGLQLADVAALAADGWLLAVDEKRHELLVLQWDAGDLRLAERISVSRSPISIAVSKDGSRCTVASLWSRTITTFGIQAAKGPPTLSKPSELALSFAPGEQLFLPDGEHVLVADAFTNQLALLDVTAQQATDIPAKDVFRIYGMALSSNLGGFYIAHQSLRRLPPMQQPKGVPENDDAKALHNFIGEYSIEG